MAQQSQFARYKGARRLLVVEMNEAQILKPDNQAFNAIGTKDLNACVCIVILGQAIIMAHCSVYPPGAQDDRLDVDIDNTTNSAFLSGVLRQVRQLYDQNLQYFPQGSASWGIFARFKSGREPSVLQNTKRVTAEWFLNWGLPYTPAYYDVEPIANRDEWKPGHGTVVAVFRKLEEQPRLLVEDIDQATKTELPSRDDPSSTAARRRAAIAAPVAAPATQSPAQPLYWSFDESRREFIRYNGRSEEYRGKTPPPRHTKVYFWQSQCWKYSDGTRWVEYTAPPPAAPESRAAAAPPAASSSRTATASSSVAVASSSRATSSSTANTGAPPSAWQYFPETETENAVYIHREGGRTTERRTQCPHNVPIYHRGLQQWIISDGPGSRPRLYNG